MLSPAQRVALLDRDERDAVLARFDEDQLLADWRFWARPEQVPPIDGWFIFVYMGGRGSGKTRGGGEWVIDRAARGARAGGLVGRTTRETIDIMLEGPSGLEKLCERRRVHYKHVPSKRAVTIRHPRQEAMKLTTFSAQEPEQSQGYGLDTLWCDERGSWPRRQDDAGRTTWDNLVFTMRSIGLVPPQIMVTTTPRASKEMRELVAGTWGDTLSVRSTLYDNLANLAPEFVNAITARYGGTRLGRQEIYGELLSDAGVMMQRRWFEIVQTIPASFNQSVRFWDLAASEESDSTPNPDYTAGVLVSVDPVDRVYCIQDAREYRLTPGARDEHVKKVALSDRDKHGLRIQWFEQAKGEAGKSMVSLMSRYLDDIGVSAKGLPPAGPKIHTASNPHSRIEILATLAEQQRVKLLAGDWNERFLDQAEEFDPVDDTHDHDDMIDAANSGIIVLRNPLPALAGAAPGQRPVSRIDPSRDRHVSLVRSRSD